MIRPFLVLAPLVFLAACGGPATPDPRGVDHDETLLSVSATGEAETVPDMAYLQLGVNSYATDARAAATANADRIGQVVKALAALGVADKDTQTRDLSIRKVDWGPNKGRFEASNVLELRVRDIAKASEVVAAATQAGMNVLSGPSLRVSDPEGASKGAYAAAYKAARTRAQAYADAAGLRISRVLTIRDGGSMPLAGPVSMDVMAQQVAAPPPPPVAMVGAGVTTVAPMPAIRAGSTITRVSVQVDFALAPK